ncbi:MAG: hypothetical protein E6G94_11705 [Alphaproteobacteria bacterium]|nr:MAG: hypothetical protein E6G94_11705 [Alphaproteobacteria bacterium]
MVRNCAILALLVMAAAPAFGEAPPARSNAPRDKMVCKNFPRIGSLVAQNRVCKTRADWQKDRDMMRVQMGVTPCAIQPCEMPGK